ncbi:hypothetical protein AAHC63_00190 [Klebsiella quasipneumoniae subsp. quasipneumoniae]|uniref:hypothetical protein n=1 Tax=Klebsiella quasipneumoniae TaxID=1463165 RepID=UPI003967BFF7
MAKSTITRERLAEIAQFGFSSAITPANDFEIKELARMALAAMDSEPVAWTDEQELRDVDRGGCGYLFTVNPVTPHADERRIILLYRHAQQPVVPDGLNHETTNLVLRFASALADKLYKAEQKYGRSIDWMKDDWYDDCLQSLLEHIEKGDPRDVAAYCAFMWHHGWKTKVAQPEQEEKKSISDRQAIVALEGAGAVTPIGRAYKICCDSCRAAMLQASPVCTRPSGDGSLRWPCPVHPGNYPTQSDCCPAQNHVSPAQNSVAPAQSPIDHGYRPECECSGCKDTARICAELSANSSANPDCWCRTCRPVVLNDMRFVVCPDCGNKRCPRANDHRNACTGSNDPGQEGSAYPDTPREVKP